MSSQAVDRIQILKSSRRAKQQNEQHRETLHSLSRMTSDIRRGYCPSYSFRISKSPSAHLVCHCHCIQPQGCKINKIWLIVPRHRRTIFSRRAFTVAGPTAWNSLSDYLRDPSLSEDIFRRLLMTYLFALY